jgi:alpha-glucosidase
MTWSLSANMRFTFVHALVARCGDLSDLSAQLRRFERRRHRRSARHHRASRPCRILGVDAIWLSPFFTSPMRDFGYDVADYCDVDPIFGTLADFDALIARAHALGLQVIIDQVYAHTSDQHPWFHESRADRDNPKPTGMSGPTRSPTARRPTTGSRCSAARPGPGTRGGANITCTISSASSRSSTCICPAVQEGVARRRALLARSRRRRFPARCDQLRDARPRCATIRPRPDRGHAAHAAVRFPAHIYNQSHPDIPAFLERCAR